MNWPSYNDDHFGGGILNTQKYFLLFFSLLLMACSPALQATNTPPALISSPIPPTPANPSPGSYGLGDSYYPHLGNGGYDVQSYFIDLEVDMDINSISGSTIIIAQATQDLNQLNLDFIGLEISEILVNGQVIQYERELGELILASISIAEGQIFEIKITYAGTPGEGIDTSKLDAFELGWGYYGEGVYVAGEPSGSSTWYPVNEHPSDKALYKFEITVAEPFDVAANGLLQEVRQGDGVRTFVWEAEDPISSYLVTIAIANFDIEEEIGPNGVVIRNYFEESIASFTRNNFDDQSAMIALFNDLFGPYPFEAYGVVVHDLDLGFALETQTLSVFGRSFTNTEVVSHELAHQWFGNSVTLASWKDIWLNEGFATYASVLWSEFNSSPAIAEETLKSMYEDMAPGEPVYEISRNDLARGLINLLPGDQSFPLEASKTALHGMFTGFVPEEELTASIEALINQELSLDDFEVFISNLSLRNFSLPSSRFATFFNDLSLDELSFEFQAKYPPPGDPGANNLFSRSVYQRGALTLHALRLEIGDEAFFNTLRAFFEKFANSNASTADFIAVAEDISGDELNEFFDAWLYQSQIPDMPELDLYFSDYVNQ